MGRAGIVTRHRHGGSGVGVADGVEAVTSSGAGNGGSGSRGLGGVGHLRGVKDLPSAELQRFYESAYKRRAGVIDRRRERREKSAARAVKLARNAARREREKEAARRTRIEQWREHRERRRMAGEDTRADAMRRAERTAAKEAARRAWLRAAQRRLCPNGAPAPSHRCGRVRYLAHLGLKRGARTAAGGVG